MLVIPVKRKKEKKKKLATRLLNAVVAASKLKEERQEILLGIYKNDNAPAQGDHRELAAVSFNDFHNSLISSLIFKLIKISANFQDTTNYTTDVKLICNANNTLMRKMRSRLGTLTL